jgi:4-hydroxybenzoate polyprenyltransferase
LEVNKKNINNILSNINEMIMFKHSIFSFPFIFIAMIVAADGWFGFGLLILGVLAAITARNFAMGINRYLDRDIDILNPRTKDRPSVDGRVSASTQMTFVIANALGFIATAYFVNDLAFYVSIPILFVLGIYSYMKRFSYYAHMVLGVALALAPIAGVIAVEGAITMWSIFLSLGVMFWVAGFDLLYSLQDMDFDKEQGLHSVPSIFGSKCTILVSEIFHILTILFWLFFAVEASLGLWVYFGLLLASIMLFYEHKIVRTDFEKIDRAFFTINGYLGIMMFVVVVLDKVF